MSNIQPEDRKTFVLAGRSYFTITSKKTGRRYTYRVKKKKDEDFWFVSYLYGPDNTRDYRYIGIITAKHEFRDTQKSHRGAMLDAFQWFWSFPSSDLVDFHHEGRCGRCGRMLTVPKSIEIGYGPECGQFIPQGNPEPEKKKKEPYHYLVNDDQCSCGCDTCLCQLCVSVVCGSHVTYFHNDSRLGGRSGNICLHCQGVTNDGGKTDPVRT